MKMLVTGASGFVGSRLAAALVDHGHDVRAMTRRPERYAGAGTAVAGDVGDPSSLHAPLAGVDVAYYLVHSLGEDDFARTDAAAARAFGAAAAGAGVRRIVYLSGLGADDPAQLSPHLRSRREVEGLLAEAGARVTVLRAAIIVGHGGISWEITRQLVKNLPVMVTPRWVNTRTQPIALADAVRSLVTMADHPAAEGRVFEIGGPEPMTYADMLRTAARLHHGRPLPIVVLPLLTPRLSSRWISLVTDVDPRTARHLIESMTTEVVVRDRSVEGLCAGPLATYEQAVEAAFAARAQAEAAGSAPAEPSSRKGRRSRLPGRGGGRSA